MPAGRLYTAHQLFLDRSKKRQPDWTAFAQQLPPNLLYSHHFNIYENVTNLKLRVGNSIYPVDNRFGPSIGLVWLDNWLYAEPRTYNNL